MRLDLFLKVSRIVPRRTVAQEMCDKGRVTVNDAAAKSSKEIKAGDRISVRRRDTVSKFVVREVPEKKQVSKEAAAGLIEVVSTEQVADPPTLVFGEPAGPANSR